MRKRRNKYVSLLMAVCLMLPFASSIAALAAGLPEELTDTEYLVVHGTEDEYDGLGGPSALTVERADGTEILSEGNVYSDVPEGATIDLEYVFHLEDGDGEGEMYTYSGDNFFTITLPEGITFDPPADEAQPIMAEDESGDEWQLGTWSFTDGHTILVALSDEAGNHRSIWGKVGVTGTFRTLEDGENTSTQLQLGTQTVVFEREVPPPPEIELEKEGAYDAETNTITWTVTVTPPTGVDLAGYSLADTYSPNQTFQTDSFRVGETDIAVEALDLTAENQVAYTFPENTLGVQTITYKTAPQTFSAENGTSAEVSTFTNEAVVQSGGDPITDPVTADVTTDWVSKSGSKAVTGDGSIVIKWEVKATVPKGAANAYIADTIPAGLQLVDNATYPVKIGAETVSAGTGAGTYSYTYTDDTTASALTCRFPDGFAAAETATATWTYYTQVVNRDKWLNSNGAVTFTNSAALHWDAMPDAGNPPRDTATVTGVGAGGLLSKGAGGTTDYGYPGDIKWTVTVNRNAIAINNAMVTDTVPAGQALLIDAEHPLRVTGGAEPVEITSAATGGSFTYNGSNSFSYALGNITAQYTITYYTRIVDVNTDSNADAAGLDTLYQNGEVKFKNKAELSSGNGVSAETEPTKTYSSQMLTKDAGSYDYAAHTVRWTITVNRNRLPLTNAVVADSQLPEGMVLLLDDMHPFTVTKRGETTPVATTPASGENGGASFTCNLGTIDDEYTISFYTLLTDEALRTQWTGTRPFTNTAELTADQIPTKVTASGKADIKNPVVMKSGTYTGNADHIDWTVAINAGLLTLSDAFVTDELHEGLALDPDSLKLYEADVAAGDGAVTSSGTPVPVENYTVTLPTDQNNNTLTVALPDGKAAYFLEFTTNILLDDINFTNEVSLSGSTGSPSGDASAEHIVINDLWSKGGSGSRTLNVHKEDGAGSAVEGATYALLNLNGQPVTRSGNPITAVTDENGNAAFTNLPSWIFYAQETAAPDGYLLQQEAFGGERLTTDLTYQTVDQPARGEVSFAKTSTGGSPLTGGVFTLTGQDYANNPVTSTAASVNGTVTFPDIPLGSYTITETRAPSGYRASDTVITATVSYNEDRTATVVTVTPDTLQNTHIPGGGGGGSTYGSITLQKTDASGAALAGAEFGLYDSAGKQIDTATSLSDGTVQFETVAYGTYTIRETKAPDGYVLSETEAAAVVTPGDPDTDASPYRIVNEKNGSVDEGASIEITKVDADTGAVLAGAEFTLYDAAETALLTAVSGSDGKALFSGLAKGDYTVRETAAPKGYIVSGDALAMTADSGQAYKYTVRNAKNPNEAELDGGETPGGSLELGGGKTPGGSLELNGGRTPGGTLELGGGKAPGGGAVCRRLAVSGTRRRSLFWARR
ncbi:MAG: SpaA isopeptide-forming pilin-related protein [Intestinibacillus sp.]